MVAGDSVAARLSTLPFHIKLEFCLINTKRGTSPTLILPRQMIFELPGLLRFQLVVSQNGLEVTNKIFKDL
jgi:hypothetical protein